MGTQEMGAALDAVERIGIINVALLVIVFALAFERMWNARNNRDANKPLTDAIGALTTAVVSGDKRAEENTRAWQRVVEANTAALERAAATKDRIAIASEKLGEKVAALAVQEGEHFVATSGKLDAHAAGAKMTETTILAAVESGANKLVAIENKLTDIHAALKAIGSLEARLSDIAADIGDVLRVVQALHEDVDAQSTSELAVLTPDPSPLPSPLPSPPTPFPQGEERKEE